MVSQPCVSFITRQHRVAGTGVIVANHRDKKTRKALKRAALMGGVAATSAAMTMGLTAPSVNALPYQKDPGTKAVTADVQNLALPVNLGPLLEALGVDLGAINGPLDTLDALGINLVTTGPPFGLAALFGLNVGYVPALPPLLVDEITNTGTITLGPALGQLLASLGLGQLAALLANLPLGLPIHVPVVVGFGLGALGTTLAYPEIQDYFTRDGAGITILPLILVRNPGRADGGLAARFAPFLDPLVQLFGYDSVVTPEVENDTDIKILNPLASVIYKPIKIDATVEYDTLSDFPSWPNPFSLINSAAAFAFPTYILRSPDLNGVTGQLLEGLPDLLGNVASPTGAANLFLTLPVDSLPLLEPFRYPTDIANFVTGGFFRFYNPFADAIEPALKILTNLGYTNVTQDMSNPLDPYPRNFEDNYGNGDLGDGPGGVPFFTLPEGIDASRIPGDLFTALAAGIQDAFFYGGIPGIRGPLAPPVANPLADIVDLLGRLVDLNGLVDSLPGLGDFIQNTGTNLTNALEGAGIDVGDLLGGNPLGGNPLGGLFGQRSTNQGVQTLSLAQSTPEADQGASKVDTTEGANTPAAIDETGGTAPQGDVGDGTVSTDPAIVDGDGDTGAPAGPKYRGELDKALREAGKNIERSVDEAGKRLNGVAKEIQKNLNSIGKKPTHKPAATTDDGGANDSTGSQSASNDTTGSDAAA